VADEIGLLMAFARHVIVAYLNSTLVAQLGLVSGTKVHVGALSEEVVIYAKGAGGRHVHRGCGGRKSAAYVAVLC